MSEAIQRAWTAPVEVSRRDMRSGRPLDMAKHAFYRDVCLRLEQTRENAAVRYEFANREQARLHQGYAMRRIRETLGLGSAHSRRRQGDDGMWYVFFARGPQYNGRKRP